MVATVQGFGALLDVYVRQYRAEIGAELRNADTNYRRPDSTVMLDQDIEALSQVYAQVDNLMTRDVVCTQRIFTQARMLVVLAEANAGAVQSHLPLVQEADLSYINGPMVSVLNQGRLMASAKRLQDIDGHFFRNIVNTVNQVRTTLAIAFPKPLPDPGPQPGPHPGPQPRPRPQRAPEPSDDVNLEPSYEDAGVNELGALKRKAVDVEEGEIHPTSPADMFPTPPSPLDGLSRRGETGWQAKGHEHAPKKTTPKKTAAKNAPTMISALIGHEINTAANTPEAEI